MANAGNRFLRTLLIPVLVVLALLAAFSLYTVDEREKALVLRLGRVVNVKETPGLGMKLPFLDDVVRYDDRMLGLQTTPLEITPLDDRRLIVDAFARWRIADVVRFRQAVGTGGEEAALGRLDPIVRTAIREVLGEVPSTAVLSDDRTSLMNRIRDEARSNSEGLGVEIIDVRLTRTDLPEQNLSATYERMRAEREREAADEIARGEEAAQRVRAAADRTVTELTSEANRNAEIIRGEADAARNAIYADAYGRDPEFFAFTRSLTSYAEALKGENSQLVLPPDGDFFTYLRNDGAAGAQPATPAEDLPQETTRTTLPENGGSAADGATPIQADSAVTPKPLEMPWDSEEGAGLGDASTLSEDSPVMPADDAEVSGETVDTDAPADVAAEQPADAAPAEEAVPDATDAAPEQPAAEAPDQDAEAQPEN
ncbi:protease modulator HflC [Paracoccus sp. SCSIO 75233]|uniref:protease modulator HflC n=1 Tax=Paracoccus sp. SCSIO 75233 TaxID=3017782 RepID=UPI0022F0C852|nr:protease modulator HflC [Paracoccus sp. SCSIO 75233]WBU52086.1 protease modulator HflC [Paracoccus sp. SCSIO 75233]